MRNSSSSRFDAGRINDLRSCYKFDSGSFQLYSMKIKALWDPVWNLINAQLNSKFEDKCSKILLSYIQTDFNLIQLGG